MANSHGKKFLATQTELYFIIYSQFVHQITGADPKVEEGGGRDTDIE